jgi:hypothetical protein
MKTDEILSKSDLTCLEIDLIFIEANIRRILKPYLENCASIGIRDPGINEYIDKCAGGATANIMKLIKGETNGTKRT